ncbi:MAG TPA: hypothetical protein VFP97_05650, partial [Chitinophagaceae bacterium]|nr:hypothetical protein [Chitinophagaceae bacterium]
FGEIAYLATGLAKSGVILDLNISDSSYDIPSTGGHGSLTTLISPLVLVNLGKKVFKLAVPVCPCRGKIRN